MLLYITLPESDKTSWFPVAGITLIGIPWAFWVLMLLYRILFPCIDNLKSIIKPSTSDKTEAMIEGSSDGDAVIDVREGSKPEFSQTTSEKKVRFGDDDDNQDSKPLTSSMS